MTPAMRRAFILPAASLCLFIGCSSSNGNSKQVRDLQATVAALQRQATQTPTPTASPATPSPTPTPATSSLTPAPAPQVSAAPIGNGCPVEFPIKVTAPKLAYNVDHPGYGMPFRPSATPIWMLQLGPNMPLRHRRSPK